MKFQAAWRSQCGRGTEQQTAWSLSCLLSTYWNQRKFLTPSLEVIFFPSSLEQTKELGSRVED